MTGRSGTAVGGGQAGARVLLSGRTVEYRHHEVWQHFVFLGYAVRS